MKQQLSVGSGGGGIGSGGRIGKVILPFAHFLLTFRFSCGRKDICLLGVSVVHGRLVVKIDCK